MALRGELEAAREAAAREAARFEGMHEKMKREHDAVTNERDETLAMVEATAGELQHAKGDILTLERPALGRKGGLTPLHDANSNILIGRLVGETCAALELEASLGGEKRRRDIQKVERLESLIAESSEVAPRNAHPYCV